MEMNQEDGYLISPIITVNHQRITCKVGLRYWLEYKQLRKLYTLLICIEELNRDVCTCIVRIVFNIALGNFFANNRHRVEFHAVEHQIRVLTPHSMYRELRDRYAGTVVYYGESTVFVPHQMFHDEIISDAIGKIQYKEEARIKLVKAHHSRLWRLLSLVCLYIFLWSVYAALYSRSMATICATVAEVPSLGATCESLILRLTIAVVMQFFSPPFVGIQLLSTWLVGQWLISWQLVYGIQRAKDLFFDPSQSLTKRAPFPIILLFWILMFLWYWSNWSL